MQGDEIPVESKAFAGLIKACAAVGDAVGARAYFNAAKAAAARAGEECASRECYSEMISALAHGQCLGQSFSAKRYLTRPRGWPVIPDLGPPEEATAEDKVAHLTWNVMDEVKGKKFGGFFKEGERFMLDDGAKLDGTGDDDSDDEGYGSYGEEGDQEVYNRASFEEGSSELVTMPGKNTVGDVVAAVDDVKMQGLSWKAHMEKQRLEAAAIIAKGERKRLAKERRALEGNDMLLDMPVSRWICGQLAFTRCVFSAAMGVSTLRSFK